ncbi:MAG: MFS transporter [Prevotellaceae bacterium]|jgi:MFS family permease|nr:MFS transporter [Prevotellaceae bacterium]
MNRKTEMTAGQRGVYVTIAAICMAATFPGRTQGLGMITEALLRDLNIDRITYGYYNLWTALLGALFCIPAGTALDRYGCRRTLIAVIGALGISVLCMSAVQSETGLFATLLATRGFGQSALSVASIALISKYFPKRKLGVSMGFYSIQTSFFFMAVFGAVGWALEHVGNYVATVNGIEIAIAGWRLVWGGIGIVLLLVCLPSVLVGVRRDRLAAGDSGGRSGADTLAADADSRESPDETSGLTFGTAIRTGAFWIFGLSISFFNLVSSGIGLYNEHILVERGFDAETYHFLLVMAVPFGLAANMAAGIMARRAGVRPLLIVCLTIMGATKFMFPFVETLAQVYVYTAAFSLAGGGLSVLFFIVWADLFGKREAGRIQGAAQMMTVAASAVGPVLFAFSKEWTGAYNAAFCASGILSLAFALTACFITTKFTEKHKLQS